MIEFIVICAVIVAILVLICIIIAICNFFKERKMKGLSSPQSNYESISPGTSQKNEDILSGLRNNKESCYINAMIQALASSNVLIGEYENIFWKCQNPEEKSKLDMFILLLRNMNSSTDKDKSAQCNTASLQQLIKEVNWKAESQQDTFHFLSAVINAIEKDMPKVLSKEDITIPPKFQVLHAFSENSSSNKVQKHLALALTLVHKFQTSPGPSVNDLLENFFAPSQIDDSDFQTQLFFFRSAPSVLIIHIQANEWSASQGMYVKPTYFIHYDKTLQHVFNIPQNLDGSGIVKMSVTYKLTAVIHHMGSISGGHYVTYRTHNHKWFLTNDLQIQETSFSNKIVPYVMVYEKTDEERKY